MYKKGGENEKGKKNDIHSIIKEYLLLLLYPKTPNIDSSKKSCVRSWTRAWTMRRCTTPLAIGSSLIITAGRPPPPPRRRTKTI